MRISWYSPLPPSPCAAARYSALLLPALRERVDVVASARKRRWRGEPETDVAVYQLADDPAEHAWIVELLVRRPGLVVLHDSSLHRLVAAVTLGRGDRDGYLRALERDAGLPGRLLGHAVADGRIDPLWQTHPEQYPLLSELLDRASGVAVHSRGLERRVREAGFRGRVWLLPYPAPLVEGARVGCAETAAAVDRVAEAYVAVLEQAAGAEAVLDSVLHELAQAAADVGLGAGPGDVRELAARLREVGLG
jgi:hypothetical protein